MSGTPYTCGAAHALTERLGAVRAKIDQAAQNAGRDARDVRLVAVSKYHSVETIEWAFAQGQRDFGENYAQELGAKAEALAAQGIRPTWHFIGQLQRNKVASVVAWADVIHSVDSLKLARAISAAHDRKVCAPGTQRRPTAILIQVNLGDEPQKAGIAPDEVVALAQAVVSLPHLQLWGLMAVPPDPRGGDEADAQGPDASLAHFRALARLQVAVHKACGGRTQNQLSMGMSHDFASAIGVGATLVRIGTAIFGPRPRHRSAP